MKKIIIILTYAFVFFGCDQSNPPTATDQTSNSGTVAFSFDKVNAPSAVKTLTTILTRSGYSTLQKTINIAADTSASILFEQVAIGTWKVKVDAKDENGQVLYTGQSEVIVLENSVSQVNLVLTPVTSGVGSVQINVTWGPISKTFFPKTYGGNSREAATCVVPTNDGGYIMGGITNTLGTGGDAWLIKTSSKGELLWSKNYGSTAEDRINDILQSDDGGYILVGYSTYGDEDSWVVKVDSLGNKIWEKKFGGSGDDAFLKIKKGFDGAFWLCGYYYNDKFYEGRVAKINPTGALLWSKTYGGSGGDFAMNILPLQSGEAIVIGNNGSIPGQSYDFWAFKVSNEGLVLWEKNYGGTNDDRVAGICLTPEGNYMLSGYTTSFGNGTQDAWIINVNDTGKVNWSKTFGEFGYDYLLSIEKTSDNNYVAAGLTSSFGNGQQGWAVKIDQFGNFKWSKVFGGIGTESISDHNSTEDGGFVFGGTSNSTNSKSDDFWLGKVNANGELE